MVLKLAEFADNVVVYIQDSKVRRSMEFGIYHQLGSVYLKTYAPIYCTSHYDYDYYSAANAKSH